MNKVLKRSNLNQIYKLSCSIVALGSLAFSVSSNAAPKVSGGLPPTVKSLKQAGSGACLPSIKGNADSILSQNKMTVTANGKKIDGNDPRAKALAQVVGTINGLKSGMVKNIKFKFGTGGNVSRNTSMSDIQLNGIPGSGNSNITGGGTSKYGGTDNRALIAHEIGHNVGMQNGNYAKYQKAVGGSRCVLSSYCNHVSKAGPRNEEFAEMFAAYITDPDQFRKKNTAACGKALMFMNKLFGKPAIAKATCATRKSGATILGKATGKGGNNGMGDLLNQILGMKPEQKEKKKKRCRMYCNKETFASDSNEAAAVETGSVRSAVGGSALDE